MNYRTHLCWSELQIGDFYLDVRVMHYCIKIGDNTFFDLDTDHTYRKVKVQHEIQRYIKCDYEVW